MSDIERNGFISIVNSVQADHSQKLRRHDCPNLEKIQEGFFPIGCQLNISGVNQAKDYKLHGYPTLNRKFARLIYINATIERYRALSSGN